MVIFSFEEFECDGAGFRPFGAYAMADSLLCIFGHQALQFGLGFFVLEICGPGSEKNAANSAQALEELISTMRTASIRGRDKKRKPQC